MKDPVLQISEEFFRDLQHSIRTAEKRIWIQVMIFEVGPSMDIYTQLLCDAAQRGVDVQVVVDWISERYYEESLDVYPAITFPRKEKHQQFHELTQRMLSTLINAGVSVTIDKKPSFIGKYILLGNRNHNKIYIVDDNAWIGGANLVVPNRFIDFMVRIYDKRLVDILSYYFFHKNKHDARISCTENYALLIDCGKKGKSLIYDTALKSIKESKKEIILVSQMLPDNGLLHALLHQSEKGVKITVVISNSGHNIFTKFPFRYHYSLFQSKIKHNQNFSLIHSSKLIHAKLLVIDRNIALFGSHNFAKWNKLVGIEETDFLTKDISLVKQCLNFSHSLVTSS